MRPVFPLRFENETQYEAIKSAAGGLGISINEFILGKLEGTRVQKETSGLVRKGEDERPAVGGLRPDGEEPGKEHPASLSGVESAGQRRGTRGVAKAAPTKSQGKKPSQADANGYCQHRVYAATCKTCNAGD